MKYILLITLLFTAVNGVEITTKNSLDIDNEGFLKNTSSLSLTKIETKIGKLGLYGTANYGSYDDAFIYSNFTSKVVDASLSWENQFWNFYLFGKIGINDFGNIANSIGYNATLAYSFSDKLTSVVKLGYEKDLLKENPMTIFYKQNQQAIIGEYQYNSSISDFAVYGKYSFTDKIDSTIIVPAVKSVEANEILNTYAYYTRKISEDGTFSLGGIVSYANSAKSFNRSILINENFSSIYYPYYTPLHKMTAELLIAKMFVIKKTVWITLKTQIPLFSYEELSSTEITESNIIVLAKTVDAEDALKGGTGTGQGTGSGNSGESPSILGTQDLKFALDVVFPIANRVKVNISYEYSQKPYTEYGYLDFDNSYINNNINLSLLWKF